MFANARTDFPPIIEALAKLSDDEKLVAVTVPHETACVAMAHGYYLVTGQPQAVMLHVNVGLANAAMGVINAASDNVPVRVMSGRTPITATAAAAVVFSELGILSGMMDLAGPNRVFSNPHSGGLGWALSAALGAQMADRDRLTVACIGDGSYIVDNPVACHQIAEALDLPVLTSIENNGRWNAVRRSVVNAYPGGAAARANTGRRRGPTQCR